jgi:hypothetical protein
MLTLAAGGSTRKRCAGVKRTLPRPSQELNVITHGNLFDDLGFSPEQARALKFKAELHQAVLNYAQEYPLLSRIDDLP